MATENFLTYPEVDPNSRITVTSSKVSWVDLSRGEDAYVYSDKGAAYFDGDFVHLVTICATGTEQEAEGGYWALTNDLDDLRGLWSGSKSFLYLYYTNPSSPNELRLSIRESDSGTLYASSNKVMVVNTVYYLKIVRDEAVGTYGTLYCYIYSDAARTTLTNTLSVALHTSKKDFRYVHVVQTWNAGTSSYTHSGYTEDLTIEGGSASVLPEVTQQAPTSITATTCTGNGRINSLGLSAVTAHGHCWATTANPTTADSKVDNGAGALGAFTSAITGLTPGVTYHIRAYATNSYGTAYSVNYKIVSGNPIISGDAGSIFMLGDATYIYDGNGVLQKVTSAVV